MTSIPPGPTATSLVQRVRAWASPPASGVVLVSGGIGVVLLWCFWPTLERVADRWARDPQYSHGFLVPVFAAIILWCRRERLADVVVRPSWWGWPVLAVGLSMHVVGGAEDNQPIDAFALLPTLAGLVLLLGGKAVLRWSWPAIAFLAFMLPLPFGIEMTLALPLRRLATLATTYVLQTLGYPAIAEGNIIIIEQLRLGVIEACSGLGMLVTFFALATAMALVIDAPWPDRWLLVASAIPIALIANVARISATAVAHQAFGSDVANLIMHDLAGWFMMPLALLLLWLELRYLAHLFLPLERAEPLPVLQGRAAGR